MRDILTIPEAVNLAREAGVTDQGANGQMDCAGFLVSSPTWTF
jgi:hypothetical protein